MVNSSGHDGSLRARSYGFRWFLEFYLLYAAEKIRGQPTVLMLEEPGTYLHPSAQASLKDLIWDEVAKHNQVIYTTHLPGLYDAARPESARGVRRSNTDPAVTVIEGSYDSDKQRLTWQVAMEAFGIHNSEMTLYPNNVLVEGQTDQVLLLTMAQLLSPVNAGLQKLASGIVHIRACGGTEGLKKVVPLFAQEGIRSVVFADHDPQGQGLMETLANKIGVPNEQIVDAFTISGIRAFGDALPAGDHDIEHFTRHRPLHRPR